MENFGVICIFLQLRPKIAAIALTLSRNVMPASNLSFIGYWYFGRRLAMRKYVNINGA